MKYFSILFIIIILLSSCTVKEKAEGPKIDKLPDIALYNTQISLKAEESEDIVITASYVEYLEDKVEIHDMEFEQLDEKGNLYLVGQAKKGNVDTLTKVMVLSEGAILEQKQEGIRISCDNLEFKYEDAIINSDGRVSLNYGDIALEAIGLSANMNSLSFELGEILKGSIND